MEGKKKKLRISTKIPLLFFVLCIIINVAAWLSKGFSDWYIKNVFPLWERTMGKLTSMVSFSVGEILIIIALIWIPVSLIILIILLIKKKGRRGKVFKGFCKIYFWLITFILVTETLNCFVLYHGSEFSELYSMPQKEYNSQQLAKLCEDIIVKTNDCSGKVKRDKDGKFVLTSDLDETAKSAVKNLSKDYPQLNGFYCTPKPVKCSYFMSQQYLMGIYFPFTMEANYNQEMYSSNLPDTVCHELVHTKGFIREDEASFIAFLACTKSDNADYQYSGYLNALDYVLNQTLENCDEETSEKLIKMISEPVAKDYTSDKEYWRKVNEDDSGLVSSKTLAKISDKVMDTSLKLNGVEDGKKSYGRMVDLLLNYYYGGK